MTAATSAAPTKPFWTLTAPQMAAMLGCGLEGLSVEDARDRLQRYGLNRDQAARRDRLTASLGRRLLEPLSLVLLGAAAVSAATGDHPSAVIIIVILLLSIGLDMVQERRAMRAAEMLRRSVAVRTRARRDGADAALEAEAIVPGDVIHLSAGDVTPADALILSCDGLLVDEAALTGEPYPVEKRPGPTSAASAAEASGALFRGSVIRSGEATALVAATGRETLFGAAASVLAEQTVASPFQRDLRSLGFLIVRLTGVLVVVVLAAHVMFGRPVLQSLMFAVALAVGLTPELLPMITTVTLARGAVRLARRKVIVKRLASVHDLGAMTVLCTDKTGTLTSAKITLEKTMDAAGAASERAHLLGAVSALFSRDDSAIDAALAAAAPDEAGHWRLVDRRPFDFARRFGAVVAEGPEGRLLLVKGAPEAVLPLCSAVRTGGGAAALDDGGRTAVLAGVQALAEDGLRAIAIASRTAADDGGAAQDLIFEGLCAFDDPPKPSAPAAITRLTAAGVTVKILSGDHPAAVGRMAALMGLRPTVLTGAQIAELSLDALAVRARAVDAYARLAPDQKARLVRALQASGAVVGFLGDGINDAPGIRIADIGLSVDGATGVAREAADMILLDSDLAVVADGVDEGRRTFANIIKYVRMGASSNFGNMLSMAVASLLLPFLPMLPTQILLNNLLYDMSEIGIPMDSVPAEETAQPQVWSLKGLLRFTVIMGPLSSVFDLTTFAVLFFWPSVTQDMFRTGWFVESMATQILVIFAIRLRAPFWTSQPHPALVLSSLGALAIALALPFSPLAAWFGFAAPPTGALAVLAVLVIAYLAAAELLKRWAAASPPSRETHRRRKAPGPPLLPKNSPRTSHARGGGATITPRPQRRRSI